MINIEILPKIDIMVRFEKTEGKVYLTIVNNHTNRMRVLKPFPIDKAHMILNRIKQTKIAVAEERLKRKLNL